MDFIEQFLKTSHWSNLAHQEGADPHEGSLRAVSHNPFRNIFLDVFSNHYAFIFYRQLVFHTTPQDIFLVVNLDHNAFFVSVLHFMNYKSINMWKLLSELELFARDNDGWTALSLRTRALRSAYDKKARHFQRDRRGPQTALEVPHSGGDPETISRGG